MMNYRVNLIATLMVLKLSSAWAQDLTTMEKVQTNQVHADHANRSAQTERKRRNIKPGTESKPTPTKASEQIGATKDMDHGKMTHGSMPGMEQGDKSGTGEGSGHDMMHGAATSGKADDMSNMNHGGGESMSMQDGSAPPDARDPHAYSDGYDFGPIPRPRMGDEDNFGSLLVDRLESSTARGSTAMTYDWQAWYGQTYDRALIRAEGEIESGTFKDARNELLWAHAITAYLDTQLGVRYDSGKGTDRGWLAFGIQGLLPYWLYVEATAYVNEQGRTAFRLETEYDLLLTQKLILQPRIETNFYSRRDDTRDVSSGLSNIEAGLRLRYEIRREFAPYVGIEWASRFGSAADNIRTSGKDAEEARFVAGVRLWF
ncbi:copper resistance protein B [Methylobacter tundripaludum]|jgi:copper resistance protein B|uniref:copper resistance protein B n=1 Tax=Methylobacter tundripaludum TaxID=173365 RepID=UPI001F188A4B|nr:copper resistance protein B [Methylobacter tundripaludum]